MLHVTHKHKPTGWFFILVGWFVVVGIFWVISALAPIPISAQSPTATPTAGSQKPFSLPFNTPPGPGTWLLSQHFGDTIEAYNFGKYWYAAGQGLHFGIDFDVPCGTPIVAIGDGVVPTEGIDNDYFGLLPHNVIIKHPGTGYNSVYGHLSAKSPLQPGQAVKRGEVIGVSGDPDLTCESRPHLHLEIRGDDYGTAYNPVTLIDADWMMLSTIGQTSGLYPSAGFTMNLYHTQRWQSMFDQPTVKLGDRVLNQIPDGQAWPPSFKVHPSPLTLPGFTLPKLDETSRAALKQLTPAGCCSFPWWSPDSRSVRYLDGLDGDLASTMAVDVTNDDPQKVDSAPPKLLSLDGKYAIQWDAGRVTVIRLADKTPFALAAGGAWPQFSPDGTHILWHVLPADDIPGEKFSPLSEIWIARPDGSERKLIRTQQGGAVYWLDYDRILIVETVQKKSDITLDIYSIRTGKIDVLAKLHTVRGLTVAPGGSYLMYYTLYQQDSSQNGIYLLETKPGASPVKMPFFGSWRWRDSTDVLYIPYQPGTMSLVQHNVVSGEEYRITDPTTQPFTVEDSTWEVSPDGKYAVFREATDHSLWLAMLP